MKKLITLIAIIYCACGFSQKTEVVEVVSKQLYTVNGGFNSAFGGKSRILIPINLPKNTVEWYYRFSANKSKNGLSQAKAITPLTRIKDSSGNLEKILNESIDNLGDIVCDIYVIDESNANSFKKNNGFYPIQSTENLKKGVIKINKKFDKEIYLGIKNPNKYVGIHVTIEVFAVVKKITNSETWSAEIKNAVNKHYIELFKKDTSNLFSDDEKRMLANCVSEKTFEKHTVDEYLKIAKDNIEYRKTLKSIATPCLKEILGRELTEEEKRKIKYF